MWYWDRTSACFHSYRLVLFLSEGNGRLHCAGSGPLSHTPKLGAEASNGKLNRPHTRDMSAYTMVLAWKWSLFVSLVDCEHALTSIRELFHLALLDTARVRPLRRRQGN
jgi:hypothetical protein